MKIDTSIGSIDVSFVTLLQEHHPKANKQNPKSEYCMSDYFCALDSCHQTRKINSTYLPESLSLVNSCEKNNPLTPSGNQYTHQFYQPDMWAESEIMSCHNCQRIMAHKKPET